MDIPTIFTQPENFYSLACYTYILSGVICAVVIWFHMCRPFDQRSDYFYPARRQVTFFYAATALQLPYMLCPGDPGSWFFARSFGILYYPVCFALLYHRFFHMRHLWSKKLSIAYFCSPFLLLGALFVIVVFHQNDLLLPYKRLWECIMVCVSILLTYRLVKECRWVARKWRATTPKTTLTSQTFLSPLPRTCCTCQQCGSSSCGPCFFLTTRWSRHSLTLL